MNKQYIIKSEKRTFTKPRAWDEDKIFIDPNQMYWFDYSWSFSQYFTWYNDDNIKLIKQLKSVFPEEEKLLNILIRRIKYIYMLHYELKFISERYKWDELKGAYDIYLCRFEHLICQITELINYVVQFYIKHNKKYDGKKVNKFEDIGEFIINKRNGLPDYYHKGINTSVYLSILLFIRNSLVHSHEHIHYSPKEQNPLIVCDDIPEKKRYGVLNRLYLNDFIRHIGFKKESGSISITDDRFHLVNHIQLTRNSTVNHQKSKIAFEVETLELIEQFVNKTFYSLIRDLFNILKNGEK